MLIRDILETNIVTIDKEATWLDALNLMEKNDTNGLFVVDDGWHCYFGRLYSDFHRLTFL